MSPKSRSPKKPNGENICMEISSAGANAKNDNNDRRKSCHHCGNMRKKQTKCSQCPYVFCNRCTFKMKTQHGDKIFEKGCPVCLKVCCCADKKETCDKMVKVQLRYIFHSIFFN